MMAIIVTEHHIAILYVCKVWWPVVADSAGHVKVDTGIPYFGYKKLLREACQYIQSYLVILHFSAMLSQQVADATSSLML